MHACGHDVHATWAVGAAALLRRTPADGDVLVVLQPAEETGKGALSILESGALDDVAAIFGGHVDRRFEVGQVVADEGPLAASADTFEIEFIGAGRTPRVRTSREIRSLRSASVVTALQSIVARRLNPATPGVVTRRDDPCRHGAQRHSRSRPAVGNCSRGRPGSRELMLSEVRRVTESVAAGFGVEARVTLDHGTPPIVNPPGATAWAREAAVDGRRSGERRAARIPESRRRGLRALHGADSRLLSSYRCARAGRRSDPGACADVLRGGGEPFRGRGGARRMCSRGVSALS